MDVEAHPHAPPPPGKRQRQGDGDGEGEGNEVVEEERQYDVLFRSYVPRDVKLQKLKRPQTCVPDMVNTINARVAAMTARQDNQDVLSLAPKKAAWDLARDLEPKLELLSQHLDAAIIDMLRDQPQLLQ